ncbi:unnamed protein product [Rotaria sp. Silwood2]|nr:unnamed protein product [Rotaria sp. Silwood2]CAF3176361.1 unnamed protein product [Rotaria sp. Silwood2]CAF4509652.1 unnamed protein product [Rotaria sp. Silwood2]
MTTTAPFSSNENEPSSSSVSFIQSQKGKPMLVVNNCIFKFNKTTTSTKYWICTFDELVKSLSPPMKKQMNQLLEYFQEQWFNKVPTTQWCVHGLSMRTNNNAEERSASSDVGGTTILYDVLRKVSLSVSANLPTNEALLQTIRRERPAIQLDQNGRLSLILRQTDRGENFIFYEDESMVIFTCDKNLLVLNQ